MGKPNDSTRRCYSHQSEPPKSVNGAKHILIQFSTISNKVRCHKSESRRRQDQVISKTVEVYEIAEPVHKHPSKEEIHAEQL